MNTPEHGVAIDLQPPRHEKQYAFLLYVKGASPNSMRAITNIKHLLEKHLDGRHSLKIIDVHQQNGSAENEVMIALPLIVRMFPLPQRRCSGDMSDVQQVLTCLGLLNCL
jgi:circadian clock protein KaiB